MDILKDYWENLNRTKIGKRISANLVGYLSAKLAEQECDHTYKHTNEYFSHRNIIVRTIGKYWCHWFYCCDCEVAINLDWQKDLNVRTVRFKKNKNGILFFSDGSQYEAASYNCGLKAGDLLRRINDRIIKDADGNISKTLKAGELYRVNDRMPSSPKTVNLLSMDYPGINMREDSIKIFDEFEKIDFANKQILIYALYPLYKRQDLDILSEEFYKALSLTYIKCDNRSSAEKMSKAIEAAIKDKEFQFNSLTTSIPYTNEQVRSWLIKINERIKNEILN